MYDFSIFNNKTDCTEVYSSSIFSFIHIMLSMVAVYGLSCAISGLSCLGKCGKIIILYDFWIVLLGIQAVISREVFFMTFMVYFIPTMLAEYHIGVSHGSRYKSIYVAARSLVLAVIAMVLLCRMMKRDPILLDTIFFVIYPMIPYELYHSVCGMNITTNATLNVSHT